jgi:hypothetical protein
MKCKPTADGGLRLEIEASETAVFRYLVERASFLDTPPDQQEAILRMVERILEGGYGEPPQG